MERGISLETIVVVANVVVKVVTTTIMVVTMEKSWFYYGSLSCVMVMAVCSMVATMALMATNNHVGMHPYEMQNKTVGVVGGRKLLYMCSDNEGEKDDVGLKPIVEIPTEKNYVMAKVRCEKNGVVGQKDMAIMMVAGKSNLGDVEDVVAMNSD
ncbi:hypothetical protein VNO78_34781 [Psophocarpus tetragonolobus]|uniref:Uncharacterized protein n=1 Tax=Psophocarpus tetragonolobus TaxID=3891 RepID=A0AAN9NPR2_PSOTE